MNSLYLVSSEMTECEKNGLECPTGEICKQGNGTYGCACPDGFEKIRGDSTAGDKTCQGNKMKMNQMFIIREVNSDMPIYILNMQNKCRKKSDAPSEIRTHDIPISWKVL